MDSLEKIESALKKLSGRSIAHEISRIAPLPESGFLAGQAVASLAMKRLGILRDGPINDVDVFLPIETSERGLEMKILRESQTSKRRAALASHVTEASACMHGSNYGESMRSTVKQGYSILATERSGMLNEVAYSRFRRRPGTPEALALVEGFDLDCAQIAVDAATGELAWTPEFSRFLQTFELSIQNVSTPFHTAARYFRKKRQLGCGGDDAFNMALCALPTVVGSFPALTNYDPGESISPMVAGRYGQKAHADVLELADELSLWFIEKQASTRASLWTMEPRFTARPDILSALSDLHSKVSGAQPSWTLSMGDYLLSHARPFCRMALSPDPELDQRQARLETLLLKSQDPAESHFLALNARLRSDPILAPGADMAPRAASVAAALELAPILTNELSAFDMERQASLCELLSRANERHALTLFGLQRPSAHAFAARAHDKDDAAGEIFERMCSSDEAFDREVHSSVLCHAARHDNAALARDLLARGADPRLGAIHAAASCYSPRALEILLAANPSLACLPDEQGATPLIRAATHGQARACQTLLPLSDELAIDSEGHNALAAAAMHGRLDCLGVLASPAAVAQANACPDARGNHLAHLAISSTGRYSNAAPIIDFFSGLCDWRAMNTKGQSALMVACSNGSGAETIQKLAALCDPSWVDYEGRTALMLACSEGNREAFDILIKTGDPWQRDDAGRDCLDHADAHDSQYKSLRDPDNANSAKLRKILEVDIERAELRAASEASMADSSASTTSPRPKRLRI